MPFSLASNASNELKALFPNLSSDRRFRSGPASLRNTPHKKQMPCRTSLPCHSEGGKAEQGVNRCWARLSKV